MAYYVRFYLLIIIYLVFFFYYVWGFLFFFLNFFEKPINSFFLNFNKNSTVKKKFFNELNFFEKLFLVFFSKNNVFEKSLGNVFDKKNIFNFRQKKYPLIFFFHLYSEKSNYTIFKLNFFSKFYNFFKNSKNLNFFLIKIKNLFLIKLNTKYESVYLDFLTYSILQKIFYKRYYNLCSSIFFKKLDEKNLVKLNWMFFIFVINSNKKCKIYDLSKYSDWYEFSFIKSVKFNYKNTKTKANLKQKNIFLKFRDKNIIYLIKTYKYYNTFFKKINSILNIFYKNIFILDFKSLNFKKLKIIFNKSWNNKLKLFYTTRFSESSMSKYIELNNSKNYLFFFIRKNRIFNKGRYSRNRQLYRTGVYWCLWLNIILVYGLYFLFYRFTFNFGYFWWGLLIFFYSTIFSRAIKYNFYNFYKIFNELSSFVVWLSFIFYSLKNSFYNFFSFFKNIINKNIFYYTIVKFIFILHKNISKNKFTYFWENMGYEDKSIFKYKTFIHWCLQLYKTLMF